jgi:HK97 family phage prohead protease
MTLREIDPTDVRVKVDGRTIPLTEVAHARDFVRSSHMALEPFPVIDLEVLDGERSGTKGFTIRGHAAVFNRRSHDLGGFTELIAPGFFTRVLDADPDVHALWDHNTERVLARTRNKTLELREDPIGLHNWMRVAPTTFAADLKLLMQRGDIDQQSFAFTVEKDKWEQDKESGEITRTLVEAKGLYDVTITAQGAYPQTGAQVVRSIRQVLDSDHRVFAVEFDTNEHGSAIAEEENDTEVRQDPDIDVAPDEGVEHRDVAPDEGAPDEASHDEVGVAETDPELERKVRELKARAEQRQVEVERLKERVGKLS